MPSTQTVGSPSDGNQKIGGVPEIHYFDFQSRGRGQVVRLLWEDAGIAYKDTRYTFQEYPEYKESVIAQLNPAATIPVIELNGKILTQSYAILRRFARQLGAYDGQTEEEKYWVDALCDMAIDWRTLFVIAFFSPDKDKAYQEHKEGPRANFLKAINQHLQSNDLSRSGPFVLGDTITYADLVIYQICHDEQLTQDGRAGLKEFSRLAKLVDGVEGRPNVEKFLKSDRYLG